MDDSRRRASLISIVGVDGSGKTTLAEWVAGELAAAGKTPLLVWSRFRNYFSKPLLALTRITGHNYYRHIDGVMFGFHDFENLLGYREAFAALQAIDVNIAAFSRIHWRRRNADVVICERGPWDTLVDVTADTGLMWLPESGLGALYPLMLSTDARVLFVARSRERILSTRPELVHDDKLELRIGVYEKLAARNGWTVIDNNGTLEESKGQVRWALGLSMKRAQGGSRRSS